MMLVGQYDSLFTRRVAIALHHYRLPFGRNTRSVFSDAAEIARISPLTRSPALALVLEDGEMLTDSTAILVDLDERVGPKIALVPPNGPERRRILRAMALR